MANDWKERLGVVFSTNPDFQYETDKESEVTTLAPERQNLKIWLDRLKGGRVATVVRGFVGSADDLAELDDFRSQFCHVSLLSPLFSSLSRPAPGLSASRPRRPRPRRSWR